MTPAERLILAMPDCEAKVPAEPQSMWQRLMGIKNCAHCFHENPRYSQIKDGIAVRTCCYCGTSQRCELIPKDHGRYLPSSIGVDSDWSGWKSWTPYTGGYY